MHERELDRIEYSGAYLEAAELHQSAATLGRDPSATADAENCFRRAIEVARLQSARCYEVRAAISLVRLLRDTNCGDEARVTLAGIYNWFTEGFDTADLKDAKALLEELSG
jgi:hypothetical protein